MTHVESIVCLRCMGVGMGVVFTVIGMIVPAVTPVNDLSSE